MIYWRQKRVLEEIIITNTNKLTTEWLQSGQLLLLQPGLAAVCFLLLHYTIPVIQNVSSAFSDSTQAGLSYFMSTLVVLKPCWASRTHLSLCICHLGLSGLNVERKHCADEWESCKDWWADEFDWECANQYHNTIITTARLSGFLNDAITSNMVYYHYICTSSGLMKSFILPVTVAEVRRLFTFPVSKPLNSPPVWRSIWYDVRPQNRKRLQKRDGEAVTPAEGKKKKGFSLSVPRLHDAREGRVYQTWSEQTVISKHNLLLISDLRMQMPQSCMWLLWKFFLFRAERLCSVSPPPLSSAAGLTCIYTVICTPESKQQQHARTHLHVWRKADTQTPSGECDRAVSVWAGKHIKDKDESGMPAVTLEASGGEKQSTARSAARSETALSTKRLLVKFPKRIVLWWGRI